MDRTTEYLGRSCIGKVQYPTPEDAHAARARCEAKRGKRLKVYRCPACRCWHLATDTQGDAAPLCGTCLEPFEPKNAKDWQCGGCAAKGAA
jgi:hypothetical protein